MLNKLREINEHNYNEINKVIWKENELFKVKCKIMVKKYEKWINVSISDGINSLHNNFFNNNLAYELLQKLPENKFINATICLQYVKNKDYKNFNIHNLEVDIKSKEEEKEMKENRIEIQKRAIENIKSEIRNIKDDFLRELCLNIYNNHEINRKLKYSPATEFSGYSYRGGLIEMISDTLDMSNSVIDAFNRNPNSTILNPDIIKTGALLCNIGKTQYYEIDEKETITKTEKAILESEILISRDIVILHLDELMKEKNEETKELKYQNKEDLIKEIIHMITSFKSKFENSSTFQARSKHSAILAEIFSLTATKGLFEKLESENVADRIVKPYSASKSYILFGNE